MDPSAGTSASRAASRMSNILDLPDEILKEICSHCLQCDWICLSLVCKRFRELAATQLYRNFHIVFPDEDDPFFDSPIDGLAGGLTTFVSSEYNYAKHLREISLDTLSVGDKAEAAYKPYLATVSCGKFMNTLLLLTLRKATSLDAFRWNIRVELSRPVYKALHNIKSLRHLHVRLQAGPSLYEPPPPLPYSSPHFDYPTVATTSQSVSPGGSSFYSVATLYGGPPPALTPSSPTLKPSWKSRVTQKSSTTKEPPTISGFKNLETLSVLDIDNLGIITEIKACVRNSSSSLRKMKLSFSDTLATKARKPSVDADIDESEDDEFQVVPLSVNANYDNNGPAKVFRAQEERKTQESVLGRIFEVEPFLAKSFRVSAEDKKEDGSPDQHMSYEGQRFIDNINKVFKRMAAHVNGTTDFRYLDQLEALDMIAKAAKKYVVSEEAKANPGFSARDLPNTGGLPSSSEGVGLCSVPGDSTDDGIQVPTPDETHLPENDHSKHQTKAKENVYDANPDDIDIATPEEQLGTELQPIVDTLTVDSAVPKGTIDSAKVSTIPSGAGERDRIAQCFNLRYLNDTLCQLKKNADAISKETRDIGSFSEGRLRDARERLESIHRDVIDIQHEMSVMGAEMDDANARAVPVADKKEQLNRSASEYTRDTRGIALHSLSIHLIPIKASVLGRAIDLRTLKRITLLNVGEQKKFWALMMKENKLKPLPLQKVFTDDVCLQFLQLVSELDCVHEVFLLQRPPKYKPESFAPNPETTIEQIRRLILRKHLHTLRRLMIKNQADNSWDLDEKTTQLICRRGKVLEELAVIMGMRAIHIPSLVSLRALQLVSFRADDTCLSVVRETRRFIVDAISHHPQLKLEWLALGDEERATRILRKQETPKASSKREGKGKGTGKGKGVSTSLNGDSNASGPYPVFPVSWDTASESEDDDDDDIPRVPKLELIEGFAFYDIYGIRIFKKEVASGRL
ncbi:hypothetical protein AAE478_000616 [Parahypoxylon ruwenzoriense]